MDTTSEKPAAGTQPVRSPECPSDSHDILVVSTACILFLFCLLALSTLGFIAHISASPVNAITSLLVTIGFVGMKAQKKLKAVTVTVGIILGSIALVTFYYDGSWDGNAYHKVGAGLIKSGWNPIYQPLGEFANESGKFIRTNWGGFWDGFPKGSYIIAGTLYAATGVIESGKAYTLIALIGATGVITVLLREIGRIPWWQSIAVALILCVNTVSLNQVFTFYNDTLLAMTAFTTIFSLLYICIDRSGYYDRYAYLLVFISVSIGVNLKFSGIAIFAVICGTFALFIVIARIRRDKTRAPLRTPLPRTFAFLTVTGVFAIMYCGMTSYVHNFIYYNSPFFPMGVGSYSTISTALPEKYSDYPTVMQLISSLFSTTSDMPRLKIPFSFETAEIRQGIVSGFRLAGGWGLWFSGILLISLAAYVYICRKVSRQLNIAFAAIIFITFIPAFAFPYLNQARYWPFPLLIPAFVLFLLFQTRTIGIKGAVVAGVLVAVNVALPAGALLLATKTSWQAHAEFAKLAEKSHSTKVTLSLGPPDLLTTGTTEFNGMLFNLEDAGITNYVQVSPKDIQQQDQQLNRIALAWSSGRSKPLPLGIYYRAD